LLAKECRNSGQRNTNITKRGCCGLQSLVQQCNDVTVLDRTGKATIDASAGELLSNRLSALADNGKAKKLLLTCQT